MQDAEWDIHQAGRAWLSGEARERYELTPGKIEMIEGKLLWSDEERVALLGLLLENVGADRAVRLGDPDVWLGAVLARISESTRTGENEPGEDSGWPSAAWLAYVLRQLVRSQKAWHEQLDARLGAHERALREIAADFRTVRPSG